MVSMTIVLFRLHRRQRARQGRRADRRRAGDGDPPLRGRAARADRRGAQDRGSDVALAAALRAGDRARLQRRTELLRARYSVARVIVRDAKGARLGDAGSDAPRSRPRCSSSARRPQVVRNDPGRGRRRRRATPISSAPDRGPRCGGAARRQADRGHAAGRRPGEPARPPGRRRRWQNSEYRVSSFPAPGVPRARTSRSRCSTTATATDGTCASGRLIAGGDPGRLLHPRLRVRGARLALAAAPDRRLPRRRPPPGLGRLLRAGADRRPRRVRRAGRGVQQDGRASSRSAWRSSTRSARAWRTRCAASARRSPRTSTATRCWRSWSAPRSTASAAEAGRASVRPTPTRAAASRSR